MVAVLRCILSSSETSKIKYAVLLALLRRAKTIATKSHAAAAFQEARYRMVTNTDQCYINN